MGSAAVVDAVDADRPATEDAPSSRISSSSSEDDIRSITGGGGLLMMIICPVPCGTLDCPAACAAAAAADEIQSYPAQSGPNVD